MAKRIAEGHSKLEIIRCLKRYIAREVFTLIKSRRREINQVRAVARHLVLLSINLMGFAVLADLVIW